MFEQKAALSGARHVAIRNEKVNLMQDLTLEKAYFERGKQILGKNAGGMLAKLLKLRRGDVTSARAIIEVAAQKQDAKEYVSKVIGPNPGRLSKEQMHRLKAQADKQLAERHRFKPHSAEDKAAVALAHARFKAAMAQYEVPKSAWATQMRAKALAKEADKLAKTAFEVNDNEPVDF